MTSSHIIYIPAILLVGVILGFLLGARAARDQARLAAMQQEQRKAAREARAARRAAKQKAAGAGDADGTDDAAGADDVAGADDADDAGGDRAEP